MDQAPNSTTTKTKNKRPGITEQTRGKYLIQVCVNGQRKTARVTGTMADAVAAHARLVQEAQAGEAGESSPLTRYLSPGAPRQSSGSAGRLVPTLKEWLHGRWKERSGLIHKASTAKVQESQLAYLVFYLGDHRLDEVAQPKVINRYVERRLSEPPLTFRLRKDGQPVRVRGERVSNTAINQSLSILRAALNLAFKEGLLDAAPRVELLPVDDARVLVPPSDTELAAILKEAEQLRAEAPLLPEAIELSVETGLRKEELFRLTWGSVDFSMGPNREGAVRVEEQGRGRLVGGKLWTPKNRRYRVVPLSPRAREILSALKKKVDPRPDEQVLPNAEGCPYVRLQSAGKGSGKAMWRTLKEAMGHGVRWHDLRHLFAVRCLQRGIPMSTVSQWMGHSDVNLTVKRYGRFSAESHDQWRLIDRLAVPVTEVSKPVRLTVAL